MTDANQPRVLVVDDDLKLRTLLSRYLSENELAVKVVPDGAQLDRLLAREMFDLLILDIMLPGEDGLSICRRLRGTGNDIPIMMLTARGDDIDRIIGLEIGADDYLPKPFNPRELLARARALLRRRSGSVGGMPAAVEQSVSFGPNQLDLATRELHHDGQPRALTSGEFALLRILVSQPRVTLSRAQLAEQTHGREHAATERSIDVLISRLRKLVEPDPTSPRYIQTVWGRGYVFVPDPSTP
ncbi:MAG: two-component system response regulator OmpR [Halochromatium sp.]|nr:two-component system response regulator OmpR [Halochromatium sp.]